MGNPRPNPTAEWTPLAIFSRGACHVTDRPWLLSVLLVLTLGLSACEEEVVKPEVVRPIPAMKVADPDQLLKRSFPGRARAHTEVNLSFRVSGPLISRPTNVGDVVEPGDIIARIDPRDFEVRLRNVEGQLARARAQLEAMRIARPEDIRTQEAAVERAEAELTLANQELERVRRIQAEDPGAISQSLIDRNVEAQRSAEAELRRAREALQIAEVGARPEDIAAQEADILSLEATVQAAEDDLSYTYLRAPFGGTIVTTFVENFETVQAKQPIARILDKSKIEMVVNIPEQFISLVPLVESVQVRFDAFPDSDIEAKVFEIGKEASQTTRTFPVTLIMDQPEDVEILPGMAAVAMGAKGLPPEAYGVGIRVPMAAIFAPDPRQIDDTFVWVIDEATMTVSRRKVRTGAVTDVGITVVEGLEPGEWIATAGVNTLREGQQVKFLTQGGSAS